MAGKKVNILLLIDTHKKYVFFQVLGNNNNTPSCIRIIHTKSSMLRKHRWPFKNWLLMLDQALAFLAMAYDWTTISIAALCTYYWLAITSTSSTEYFMNFWLRCTEYSVFLRKYFKLVQRYMLLLARCMMISFRSWPSIGPILIWLIKTRNLEKYQCYPMKTNT